LGVFQILLHLFEFVLPLVFSVVLNFQLFLQVLDLCVLNLKLVFQLLDFVLKYLIVYSGLCFGSSIRTTFFHATVKLYFLLFILKSLVNFLFDDGVDVVTLLQEHGVPRLFGVSHHS